jgi:hypothetical protein
MLKDRTPARQRQRTTPLVARPIDGQMKTDASYPMRTCTSCGRYTTFVLDDPAGGWYACIDCGRYA